MKPKILFFDIETSPTTAYIWDLVTRYVPHSQVAEAGRTICWAAKWYGKKAVTFRSVHHHGRERMLNDIHDLLSEADMVVHYNGTKFDVPTLNREFLVDGMPPPAPFQQIDLYRTVKSRFKMLSNSMAYTLKILGMDNKLSHKGMDLWTECMAGDRKAWAIMKAYNIQDVKVMEPLYEKLLPWIQPHPNLGLYIDTEKPVCGSCGSTHLQSRGHYYTTTMRYPRYRCMDCGKWGRGRGNDLTEYDRRNMLVGVS